jgi:Fic-DOC domain mobile mystery protein B
MHYLAGAADGQTPLAPDEEAQIIPSSVATRGELDIVEQENIARAMQWAFSRNRRPARILDEPFVRRVHKRMFGDVWRWAGTYRRTPRNIGIDHWMISEAVGNLLGDVRYWADHEVYAPDELSVRFHHRLVTIHPFPNGNGRHARLVGDILCVSLGGDRLSWGSGLALDAAALRKVYVDALQAADQGDVASLIQFAGS